MKQSHFNSGNAITLTGIGAAGVLALWMEGYLPAVNLSFAALGLVVFALGFWYAAFEISSRRFLLLAGISAAGGYVTQYVGADLGAMWQYSPPNHTYYYVPSLFVMASTLASGKRSFPGPLPNE